MKSLGCSQESAAVRAQLSWHDRRGGDLPQTGSAERNPNQEHPGRMQKCCCLQVSFLTFPSPLALILHVSQTQCS